MNENDDNLKKVKRAVSMAMLQDKAKDYQNQLAALQNKEYQGRYQGLTIKIKGDFSLLDVKIDQGFYETAGKGQIEHAILSLFMNLKNAITTEQTELQQKLQGDLERMQMEMLAENGIN